MSDTKMLFGIPLLDYCLCGGAVTKGERQQIEYDPKADCFVRLCAKCLHENDKAKSNVCWN